MIARRALGALAVAAFAAGMAGCSGSGGAVATTPTPEPPPTGTGYFVGSGSGGVGGSLDFHGEDPVSEAIDQALIAQAGQAGVVPSVGIASMINEGTRPVVAPRFVAVLEGDNGAIPIEPAKDALHPADGPAARRALRLLARVPTRVPPGGAATFYVVLRGITAAEVGSVKMVVLSGHPITLQARRR